MLNLFFPTILVSTLLFAISVHAYDYARAHAGMKAIFITQLFRAVKQKDYALALEKLERLNALYPTSTKLSNLQGELLENIAIQETKEFLDRNDYEQAIQVLNDAMAGKPMSESLTVEQNRIKGLLLIKSYMEGMPYQQSKEAQIAFSQLPEPTLFQGNSDFYRTWYSKQKENLERLIRNENQRLLQELIDEIDISLCTDSEIRPLIVAQLLILLNDEDIPVDYQEILTGIANTFPKQILSYEKLRNLPGLNNRSLLFGSENKLQELALYTLYRHGSSELIGDVAQTWENESVSTVSGLLMRTQNSFEKEEYFTALVNFVRLFRLLRNFDGRGIYDQILNTYLTNPLLPTTPSVHTVLFHLNYLQKFN